MISKFLSPWDIRFWNLVKSSRKKIKIASPYVKNGVVDKLISIKNPDTNIMLITSCKLMNFYRKASDVEALRKVQNSGGKVYINQNLHSKIYLFDNNKAIVTSSNLTHGGLVKIFEYGIYLENEDIIEEINNDFILLSKNENTGLLRKTELDKIDDIITALPKETYVKLPRISEEEDLQESELFTGDIEIVKSELNTWQKDVFECLNKIPKSIFTSNEIYGFEKLLKIKHPYNNFIKDKIRQQLQELRDIGLVQFLGKRKYKKLWI